MQAHKGVRRWVLAGAALSGLLVIAGCGSSDNIGKLPAGRCLVSTDKGQKTTAFREVDCAAADAAYRIMVTKSGRSTQCPTGDYSSYRSSSKRRSSGNTLCLGLNAKVGDCFRQDVGFPTGKAAKVKCGRDATYKVTKLTDTKADKTWCGRDYMRPVDGNTGIRSALSYSQPAQTICLSKP